MVTTRRVTTRRSLHIKRADELDPCRGHKHHKQLVDNATGIQPKGPGVEQCFDLLRSLFQRLLVPNSSWWCHAWWYQPCYRYQMDLLVNTTIEVGIDLSKGDISGEGDPCGEASVGRQSTRWWIQVSRGCWSYCCIISLFSHLLFV